MHKIKRRKL